MIMFYGFLFLCVWDQCYSFMTKCCNLNRFGRMEVESLWLWKKDDGYIRVLHVCIDWFFFLFICCYFDLMVVVLSVVEWKCYVLSILVMLLSLEVGNRIRYCSSFCCIIKIEPLFGSLRFPPAPNWIEEHERKWLCPLHFSFSLFGF